MDTDIDEDIGITGEELDRIVSEQKGPILVMTSVRKLIAGFSSARQFLAATDADLRRRGRCGAKTRRMIAEIRERCFFLEKNKEERFRYDRMVARYIDEKVAELEREKEGLNPVFTANDLQAAALYMGEEKVEFIDLRRLNEFRHAMTAAQRDELKRRHEAQEAERARLEKEELERRERERAEREAKRNAAKERQEKGGRNGRK